MVDAAQMGRPVGELGWLDLKGVEGISASSHTLPLHILVSYLEAELACDVALLGIQPGQTFADAPLTPKVLAAAWEVVRAIMESLDDKAFAGVASSG